MNIYLLKAELLSIFDELEENGGELTPELETQLTINSEDVKGNIKDYVNLTKMIEDDISQIKMEQKRLKELADRKAKALEKVNKIILDAVEFFGDTKKNGVKFIDYGTGIVSTRRSTAVEINDYSVKAIGIALKELLYWYNTQNELETTAKVDEQELLTWVSEDVEKADGTKVYGVKLTDRDLDNIKVNMNFNVSLRQLITGKHYDIVRHLFESNISPDITTKVDKNELKTVLKDDDEACPNIAKLVEHKNIVIK